MSILIGLVKVMGIFYVFFVPGFVWSFVLFARKEMDWLERIVISIALSIGGVVLSVFWLNWAFDIGISLLNTCLTATGLTLLGVVGLALRRPDSRDRVYQRLREVFGGKTEGKAEE